MISGQDPIWRERERIKWARFDWERERDRIKFKVQYKIKE